MIVWKFIREKLNNNLSVVLLYVVESSGSSPGRQGFKMAVASDHTFIGTIGGGIMEHKLVELAKKMVGSSSSSVLLKRQKHDKDSPIDQSGMICSGEQWVALIPMRKDSLEIVDQILNFPEREQEASLIFNSDGIHLTTEATISASGFTFESHAEWSYVEPLFHQPVIHIVGAGHVGLALSEAMARLGFYVLIYDDREGLVTLEQNTFAHEKHIVQYESIGMHIPANPSAFVVIMTFGYRTDKIILPQLWHKEFQYLGMMGSATKIETLYNEYRAEGIDPKSWSHVHAPIGLNIHSKSSTEIAVSIAAEIILEKNKAQPSQRSATITEEKAIIAMAEKENPIDFMQAAIELASNGVDNNHGGPFGAIVVKDGKIIGRGWNQVTSIKDPTAHAEVMAIRDACSHLDDYQLTDCTIYTTCEPCPMCLGAIYWARPKMIYYACSRSDAASVGFDDEHIYDEIALPITGRRIPAAQINRDEAMKLFHRWMEKEDKQDY